MTLVLWLAGMWLGFVLGGISARLRARKLVFRPGRSGVSDIVACRLAAQSHSEQVGPGSQVAAQVFELANRLSKGQ